MSASDMICTDSYGVQESNGITPEIHAFRERISGTVDLTDSRLGRIVRLRLLGEQGFPFYDLSYCYGELRDGTPVRVQLPDHQFSRRYLTRDLIAMCRRVGVYGKGLGILSDDVISILR